MEPPATITNTLRWHFQQAQTAPSNGAQRRSACGLPGSSALVLPCMTDPRVLVGFELLQRCMGLWRTRVLDQVLAGGEWRPGLGALEQVRVVAALAQLHDDVEQPRAVRAAVHRLDVLQAPGRVT